MDNDLMNFVFPSHGFDYIINLEAPRDHANKLYHTHARKIMGKEYGCMGSKISSKQIDDRYGSLIVNQFRAADNIIGSCQIRVIPIQFFDGHHITAISAEGHAKLISPLICLLHITS